MVGCRSGLTGWFRKPSVPARGTGVQIPLPPPQAPVVQLERTSDSGSESWGFESLRARSMPKKKTVKREYSAGGVVFKKEGKKILWLMVQPNGGTRPYDQIRWQLPKGWVDEGEKVEEAALREVKEEGGIKAQLIEKIDSVQIFFRDTYQGDPKQLVTKTITFYLMEYQGETKEGPGWETKAVVWLPYEKAHRQLTFDSEKKILEKAKKILEERLF